MYHIGFVRDGEHIGYLGYEGPDVEVLQSDKKAALTMHDLKSASRRAREFLEEMLPNRLTKGDPRQLILLDLCSKDITVSEDGKSLTVDLAEKILIRVESMATGKPVETYQYEPR